MKIKVCSFENRTDSELYRIVHENHKNYCAINGYEYIEVNDFSKWPQRRFLSLLTKYIIFVSFCVYSKTKLY